MATRQDETEEEATENLRSNTGIWFKPRPDVDLDRILRFLLK